MGAVRLALQSENPSEILVLLRLCVLLGMKDRCTCQCQSIQICLPIQNRWSGVTGCYLKTGDRVQNRCWEKFAFGGQSRVGNQEPGPSTTNDTWLESFRLNPETSPLVWWTVIPCSKGPIGPQANHVHPISSRSHLLGAGLPNF